MKKEYIYIHVHMFFFFLRKIYKKTGDILPYKKETHN